MTVYRILQRTGLTCPLNKPRAKRQQRRCSNSLRQCDLKLVDARWLTTILDDHSRYFTRSQTFKDGTAENVTWLLD
jgi:hypothetical protein